MTLVLYFLVYCNSFNVLFVCLGGLCAFPKANAKLLLFLILPKFLWDIFGVFQPQPRVRGCVFVYWEG